MLAICAALGWELGPVLACAGKVRRVPHPGVRVWQPADGKRPVLLFRTGVGPERAAAATRSVLQRYRVEAIINTGTAGALVSALGTGAMVIPSVCYGEGATHAADPAWTARLRRAAENAGLAFDDGAVVTSRTPLLTSAQKLEARRRWGAAAVEMEGAAVAGEARERGVRFACARSILDPLGMEDPSEGETARMRGLIDRLKLNLRSSRQQGHFPSFPELAVGVRAVRTSLRLLFSAVLGTRDGIEEEIENAL